MKIVHSIHQPLDSRQLRAFVTLAKTLSFTLTAKELYLSQSAISHSLKVLEQEVGCRLFDRLGKKVILTQAGELLLRHAEKILQEMDTARISLHQLGQWGKGRLMIGASGTACQYILPRVLREFQKSYPHFSIEITPADSAEIFELLEKHQIDMALTLEPKGNSGLEFLPLFTDELFFLVSKEHPWALEGGVVREEISRQNYILYSKSSYTFGVIERYFEQEGKVLKMFIELGNMEAIKELIKLGLGVGILAPWIFRKEWEAGEVVALPLGKRKLTRHWGVVIRKGRPMGLAEETFVQLCHRKTQAFSSVPAEWV